MTIEAFGKAFKNLHQYSPHYAFSTWLFKIASNNCIDFLRKRRGVTISIENTQENNDNDPPIKLKSIDPDPEQKLIRIQKAILLRRIVHRLKPRYRTFRITSYNVCYTKLLRRITFFQNITGFYQHIDNCSGNE